MPLAGEQVSRVGVSPTMGQNAEMLLAGGQGWALANPEFWVENLMASMSY